MSAEPVMVAHAAGCACKRCRGFERGNELAVTHGAHVSRARLSRDPATLEMAAELWESLPVCSPADRVAVELLAVTLQRVKRAVAAIEEADGWTESSPLASYVTESADSLSRLRQDLRSWISLARKLGADLGLNPSARASLGGTLSAAELARERLRLHLVERYGDAS